MVIYAEKAMGNGHIKDIQDVIFVDKSKFDKSRTEEMAEEIEILNRKMIDQDKQYILVGPGRWGTRDRFIGIPVKWPQISQAKVITETSLEDFPLDASSGSHFFHNVTSMNVGYISIQQEQSGGFINWEVLYDQEVLEETEFFKHIRFKKPLHIRMDGKQQISVISFKK